MVYPRGGLKVLQLQRYNMHASSVKHRYNLCFHSARPGQPSEAQPVKLNHTAALHKYALVCVGEHRVHDSWRHMLPGHRVVTGHASSQLSGGMTRCTSFAQACRPQ
jgi:hypothetical protein